MSPLWTRLMTSTYLGSCRRCVPATMARPFRLRQFGRCEHRANPDRVDRDGLLHEHVLARLDGGLEVHGTKMRRGRQDDQVHAAVDDFLVRVETGEARLGRDLHFVRMLPGLGGAPILLAVLLDRAQAGVDAVLEQIAQRDDLDIGRGIDAVSHGPHPAAAAADQADADLVGARGVEPTAHDAQRRQRRRRALDEPPSRNRCVCLMCRPLRHSDHLVSEFI